MAKNQFEKPAEVMQKGVVKTRSGLMVVDSTVRFMDAFYKNGGNLTEAALSVFNCSTRGSASEMGRRYFKKAQQRGLVASYLENNDISYGDLIKHAFDKMQKSNNPAWWDRLMKEAGYAKQAIGEQRPGPAKVAVNVFQAHQSAIDEYIEDGDVIPKIDTKIEKIDVNKKEGQKD